MSNTGTIYAQPIDDAANLAELLNSINARFDQLEASITGLDHRLTSSDPNDGFLSLAEAVGGVGSAIASIDQDLGEAMSRLDAIPEAPELGDFDEVDALPTLSYFGGARLSGNGVRDGSDWSSGFYSSVALQHPGEYVEFTMVGHGVIGLMGPEKFSGFSTPSNMYFLGNAAVFFNPSKAAGTYDAICRNIGAKRDLLVEDGQSIRITLTESPEEFGITWGVVENDLVIPQVFYPISIPKAGLSLWGILGGNSQCQNMRIGRFESNLNS